MEGCLKTPRACVYHSLFRISLLNIHSHQLLLSHTHRLSPRHSTLNNHNPRFTESQSLDTSGDQRNPSPHKNSLLLIPIQWPPTTTTSSGLRYTQHKTTTGWKQTSPTTRTYNIAHIYTSAVAGWGTYRTSTSGESRAPPHLHPA